MTIEEAEEIIRSNPSSDFEAEAELRAAYDKFRHIDSLLILRKIKNF